MIPLEEIEGGIRTVIEAPKQFLHTLLIGPGAVDFHRQMHQKYGGTEPLLGFPLETDLRRHRMLWLNFDDLIHDRDYKQLIAVVRGMAGPQAERLNMLVIAAASDCNHFRGIWDGTLFNQFHLRFKVYQRCGACGKHYDDPRHDHPHNYAGSVQDFYSRKACRTCNRIHDSQP